MLRVERIKSAADDIVAAALVGEGWEEALSRFSEAAGAHGAVLMRNEGDRLAAAVTTHDVAEAVADFAAGRSPPSSRYARVRHDRALGFRIDHDDYTDEQLSRDPFYQEFLRPIGYFWHANVALSPARGESVELSLKRRLDAGPYERADAVALDAVVRELTSAACIARHALDAEVRGMACLLRRRGLRVLELDARGLVRSTDEGFEADMDGPLRVIGRRLVAVDATDQPALEQAVATGRDSLGAAALAPLTAESGRRYLLQVLPVPGRARDVFLSASTLAILIETEAQTPRFRLSPSTLRAAFGLTDREAEVASLLAEGASLVVVAKRLRIESATARTHLKRIFEKTCTSRQGELVALLAQLRL